MLGGPDWWVADDSGVWVKRDNGGVDLIDPATNEIVRSIEIAGDARQGLGFAFGALWSCSGTDVVRIDPDAGTVVDTYAVNETATNGHLVAAGDRMWVLQGDGSVLIGLDPEGAAEPTAVELPRAAPTSAPARRACGWCRRSTIRCSASTRRPVRFSRG